MSYILYHPARKISLLINFPSYHAMMCHQFQWGIILLLSSLTSPLKALTSAVTLICLNASLIYPYLTLQRTALLTLSGYKHIRTKVVLTTKAAMYPKQYFNKFIDVCTIVCHPLPNNDHLTQWKKHQLKIW